MNFNADIGSLIIVFILLAAAISVFIYIGIVIRRRGGSLSTTLFGATYEFQDKSKREAIEVVTELKAGKKWEEESSDKPKGDELPEDTNNSTRDNL
jgi:hypothetical protein